MACAVPGLGGGAVGPAGDPAGPAGRAGGAAGTTAGSAATFGVLASEKDLEATAIRMRFSRWVSSSFAGLLSGMRAAMDARGSLCLAKPMWLSANLAETTTAPAAATVTTKNAVMLRRPRRLRA